MGSLLSFAERNLLSIFNQGDAVKRRAALRRLWARDGVLWTSDGMYVGYKAVDRAVATYQGRYPEYDFRMVGEIDEIANAARVRWAFGSPRGVPAVTGLDVLVVRDGRIAAMYKFLDGPPL